MIKRPFNVMSTADILFSQRKSINSFFYEFYKNTNILEKKNYKNIEIYNILLINVFQCKLTETNIC